MLNGLIFMESPHPSLASCYEATQIGPHSDKRRLCVSLEMVSLSSLADLFLFSKKRVFNLRITTAPSMKYEPRQSKLARLADEKPI